MNFYSPRDYLLLGGLLLLGLLVGLAFDAIGWGLAWAFGAWVILQHLEYVRLRRWSERPLTRPSFRTDAWQAAADALFRTNRRQRQRSNQALTRLRQMRAVTEALPDAAVMLDAVGRIDSFNPAARTIFHLSNRDVGIHIAELVRHPKLIDFLRTVKDEPVEFTSPLEEGLRLEVRRIPVAEDRSLLLVRNVTELNRLLSMRQDFVANVSHELRTPLTVILGYLETLQEETLDAEATEALVRKLVGPAQRMHALVQDLLLLTRLESSPSLMDDDLTPVGMRTVFQHVTRALEGLSDGRHEIVTDVQSDAAVLGVANELESAVGNLLANAIRYSPNGGRITLSWIDEDDHAVLSISDEGVGIPSEHLHRLTERFYRVDLARSRVSGGTGLGLAIVKHVLKRHNTYLEIDSQLGKGSRFFCTFAPAQLRRPSHSPSAPAESQATRGKQP